MISCVETTNHNLLNDEREIIQRLGVMIKVLRDFGHVEPICHCCLRINNSKLFFELP